MKFLIDNALSPYIAEQLSILGYDAYHVRDRGMHAASDDEIFAWAASEDRVIVSADTDFGTMLALRSVAKPSFILFRRDWHQPEQQLNGIIANLPQIEAALLKGAVVIFDRQRIRIRSLPIT